MDALPSTPFPPKALRLSYRMRSANAKLSPYSQVENVFRVSVVTVPFFGWAPLENQLSSKL